MKKACCCDDLYAAYNQSKLTDLTVKCAPEADGTYPLIKVHRLVMVCVSEDILEKTTGSDSNSLYLAPYNISTMTILVELAYGRKVEIPLDMIPQLQEAVVVLKMNERIRNYVEKYARTVASSPELTEDNSDDGTQNESFRGRLTDGDITPDLYFTPDDAQTSTQRSVKTANPVQENETEDDAVRQNDALYTQNRVQLVQEKISLVVVESSSDDELIVTPPLTFRTINPHTSVKKELSAVNEGDVGLKNGQAQTPLSKRSSPREERITSAEYLENDENDESVDKLAEPVEGGACACPEDGSLQRAGRDVEETTAVPRSTSPSPSPASARQSVKNRWFSKVISDFRPLPKDPTLRKIERKLLDSVLTSEEAWPPRNRLIAVSRLIESLEFKRLENLCEGCIKFQDDIQGHTIFCLKDIKECRKKYVSCKDCGTPFSHPTVLRFHICEYKLPEKGGYDDDVYELT